MFDDISYLFSEKSKFEKEYLQLPLYDGQHRKSFEVFVTARK